MTPEKQEHANIKIWVETYHLLLELQKELPGRPNFVDLMHEALCTYAKHLNAVHRYGIEIPANPKDARPTQAPAGREGKE